MPQPFYFFLLLKRFQWFKQILEKPKLSDKHIFGHKKNPQVFPSESFRSQFNNKKNRTVLRIQMFSRNAPMHPRNANVNTIDPIIINRFAGSINQGKVFPISPYDFSFFA